MENLLLIRNIKDLSGCKTFIKNNLVRTRWRWREWGEGNGKRENKGREEGGWGGEEGGWLIHWAGVAQTSGALQPKHVLLLRLISVWDVIVLKGGVYGMRGWAEWVCPLCCWKSVDLEVRCSHVQQPIYPLLSLRACNNLLIEEKKNPQVKLGLKHRGNGAAASFWNNNVFF